jgi:hypothetical protein
VPCSTLGVISNFQSPPRFGQANHAETEMVVFRLFRDCFSGLTDPKSSRERETPEVGEIV